MHQLIWDILVGIVIGWLAGLVVQGKGLGILGNMVVGILGAILGGYLSGFLHVSVSGFWSALGMSVLGAVVLLVLLRLIRDK
ncbi:MAG: GlsB/YeaQ/YmgE family stress response membrane protein [bacterium]